MLVRIMKIFDVESKNGNILISVLKNLGLEGQKILAIMYVCTDKK